MRKLILTFFTLFISACSTPKIIPDDELARIFRDIYLTNAYVNNRGFPISIDSLSIYEPVFERHNYTSRDFQFTLGNFAKRKSARLSDVVNGAIDLLSERTRFFADRIAVEDTVMHIAREKYAAIVFSDSLIRVRRIRDTARLTVKLPVEIPADYVVDYDYFVDSTDHNPDLRFNHYVVQSARKRVQNIVRRPKTLEREHINVILSTSPLDRSIVVDLNGYEKGMTTPNLTIENLVVKRYPGKQTALEMMARSVLDYAAWDSVAPPQRRTKGYVLLD